MMDERTLEELEFLLSQSMKGFHHLFERESLREILKTPTEDTEFFSLKTMEQVQGLIVQLMKKKTLEEKRAYLQKLQPKSYELVVRAYFHIVDNSLNSGISTRH